MVKVINSYSNRSKLEDRKKIIRSISREIEGYIWRIKEAKSCVDKSKCLLLRFSNMFCIFTSKKYSNFLIDLFVFVKILYTVNSIVQLFILNHFLRNESILLGFEILSKIWHKDIFSIELKPFPADILCDISNFDREYDQVKCFLPINSFHEKIFIFLWFWLFLVSILNSIDLITWVYRLLVNKQDAYSYIIDELRLASIEFNEPNDEMLLRKFAKTYLRDEGVMVLQLFTRKSKEFVFPEIVADLFKLYKSSRSQQEIELTNVPNHNVIRYLPLPESDQITRVYDEV
jgi:hypothetical protein